MGTRDECEKMHKGILGKRETQLGKPPPKYGHVLKYHYLNIIQ